MSYRIYMLWTISLVPNVFLVLLTSALYFFYPHQFYYKKGSWFIFMLFRWAFPSTKGTHSCTWLAHIGISWVGVYLVCLPWFKKSCFKSETDFPHLFSVWYLDPASLSVVTSRPHSVIPRDFSFLFQFWHTSLFPHCWTNRSVKYPKKTKWIKMRQKIHW